MKRISLLLVLLVFAVALVAQDAPTDSLPSTVVDSRVGEWSPTALSHMGLALSTSGVALGAASHYVPVLVDVNQDVTDFFWREWHYKHPFDNYLQFGPLATIYLLKGCGLQSQHTWRQIVILTATTYATETLLTQLTKHCTQVDRPDHSNLHSFPSGHTAFAFAGAEMLRLEYRDVSPWIGVAGYLMATTTGVMRIYNKCHWAGDVLAGAGIGFLSAHLNYYVADRIFQRHSSRLALIQPAVPYQLQIYED